MKSAYEQLSEFETGIISPVLIHASMLCHLIDSSTLPDSQRQQIIDYVKNQMLLKVIEDQISRSEND